MDLQIIVTKRLPKFELHVDMASDKTQIGILGASGSGKSLLLSCVAGLVKPDEGFICLNGRVLFDSNAGINVPPRHRKIGFLFQHYALFPHLTVEENIAFGLDHLSGEQKRSRVWELLERFRLQEMGKHYPAQISGGQQQRVALARAMAIEPEIMLLDEPFSALDSHLRNHMVMEMKGYLKDFGGNTLFVTHHMEEAYAICEEILIIKSGKIEAFGEKDKLFNLPHTLETAKITGCKNLAPATAINDFEVEIQEWGIVARAQGVVEKSRGFVGIRSNHIQIAEDARGANVYPVWIASIYASPFRTEVQLKFNGASQSPDDFHLIWEVSPALAHVLSEIEQPIFIWLPPQHLFYFCD